MRVRDSRPYTRIRSIVATFVFFLAAAGLCSNVIGENSIGEMISSLHARASTSQVRADFRAYVANTGSDTVSVIDLVTGALIGAPISVGRAPSAMMVSLDQERVYVANSGANTVSVIDTSTNTVSATIQLRRSARATGLALSYDLPRLYVSHDAGNDVYVVNTDNNGTIGFPIGVQGRPAGMIWTDTPRNRLYVSTPGNQGVTAVDLSLIITRNLIETGPSPFGIAVASDGKSVYVADQETSLVSVIDTNSNEVIRTFSAGNNPDSLTLTPERRKLLVASVTSPIVTVLDPVSGSVIGSLPVGSSVNADRPGVNRLGITPDGLTAVVANADNDSISIIDLLTDQVRTVPCMGDLPTGVIVVGKAPVCDPDQSTIDFGDVRLGTGGAERELMIANRGTDVLGIPAANIDNPVFEIGGLPLEIPPRGTGRLVVRFDPVALGEETGTLSLQGNDPDPSRCVIRLRGFGRSPICTVTPAGLDFGIVRIAQRAQLPMTIGNVGNERLVIDQVESSDPQFGLASPGLPLSVEPGSSRTVMIGFTPSAIRLQTAVIRLVGNDPNPNRCAFTVQGIGQGPVCQAPGEVNFGEIPVFQTGFATVVVTNAGDEGLVINSVTIDDSQFTLGAASFPIVLGPNSSFGFLVGFTPLRVESRTATMRIFTNDPGPRCVVTLRGTGKGGICSLPSRTDFGDVPLRSSEQRSVQLSNPGNDTLIVFNAFISGSSAFQLLTQTFPIMVNPGANIGLDVRFTPTFLGFQSATLVVQTNDPVSSTCTSRLEGTGTVPPVVAYVANNGSASLSVVNVDTGEEIPPPISIQSGPTGIVKSPNGQFLYVANFNSNTVSVVDAFRNEPVDTLFIGGGPMGLAHSPIGDRVYVTNFTSSAVTVINAVTNQVIRTVRPVGATPAGIVISPDGRRLYVAATGDRTVTVIDPETLGNPIVATIPVGPATTVLAMSPDGGSVYASDSTENVVRVISTATNMVTRTITAGDGAESLVVSRDGTRLYVTNLRANTVSVITISTGVTTTSIPIGRSSATARIGPNRLSISDDGRLAVVANADDGTVTIMDLTTNVVRTTVKVGRNPLGVVILGP